MRFACLCFCTLHTNEIPRTDPLVQVDYVRVVDLDTRAIKSDICAIRVVTILIRAGRLEPATAVSVETGMANFGLRVVRRLIAKNDTKSQHRCGVRGNCILLRNDYEPPGAPPEDAATPTVP